MPHNRPTLKERCEILEGMVERMATTHIIFYKKELDGTLTPMHVDWCPLCRLEKAEQIGSPAAIADWVRDVVLPEHIAAVSPGLSPLNTPLRWNAAYVGVNAGDLIDAIRNSQVLIPDG